MSSTQQKIRGLNSDAMTEDKAGNNIALTCSSCDKVYIVSEFIHGGERACPKCGKSKGLIKGDKAQIVESSEKSSITDDQKERYVRWQNYRITQLTFAINLFLGFAVASLAFAINLKLKKEISSAVPIETIIVWWSASGMLGSIATLLRVLDFRHTALKIKEGGTFNAFIAAYLGPVTWGCFWGEVLCYAVGAFLFISRILKN